MVICLPARRSAAASGISSANNIGSPPVITTCLTVGGVFVGGVSDGDAYLNGADISDGDPSLAVGGVSDGDTYLNAADISDGNPSSRSTWPTISSTERSSPSAAEEAYGVSQNQHRRLQPLVRTKSLHVPVKRPSPWIDRKISAIRMGVTSRSDIPPDLPLPPRRTPSIAAGRRRNGRSFCPTGWDHSNCASGRNRVPAPGRGG